MIFPGRFHSRQRGCFFRERALGEIDVGKGRAVAHGREPGDGGCREGDRGNLLARDGHWLAFFVRGKVLTMMMMMMMIVLVLGIQSVDLRAIVLSTTTTTTMLKGCGTTILSKCDHSRRVIYLSSSSWSFPALFEHALVGGVQRLQRHSALLTTSSPNLPFPIRLKC